MLLILILIGYTLIGNAEGKTESIGHERKSGQLSSYYNKTKMVM